MPSEGSTSHLDAIRLISKSALCEALGITKWTIDAWIKAGKFPPPIYTTPTSPQKWRVRDVSAHLEKRRRGRRAKQQPRGIVRQRLDQVGGGITKV